jgi:hypothetical protein
MGSVLLEAAIEVEQEMAANPLCYLCYLLFKIFFFPSVTRVCLLLFEKLHLKLPT